MNLKTRLTWISVTSILATLALAVIVVFQLGQLIDRFDAFRTTSVVAEKYVLMINRDLNYCSRLTRSIMLGDNFDKNFTKLESRIGDIRSHFQLLQQAVEQLPGNQALPQAVSQAMRDSLAFVEDGRARMLRLQPEHGSAEARAEAWQAYKREASPVANSARKSFRELQELLDSHIQNNTQAMDQAMADTRSLSYIIGVIVLGVIAIGLVNASLIRSMMARLYRMRGTMNSIGENSNLTERVEVNRNDELAETGGMFNHMLEQFQQMIQQVAASAQQVSRASQELDQVSHKGLSDQQRQHEEIAQVVSAMETMRTSVADVSQDAREAADSALQAQDHSRQGIQLTQNAVGLMENLAAQTSQTNSAVKQLNDSCKEINSVLSVIQTVSEQTNLLALNAAIEAARAGEQGRGFAVVADEVRTLAIRSQESTREIQSIIEELMKRSDVAVAAMDENQQLAGESVQTTEAVLQSMAEVVNAIEHIQQTNSDIARSAEEQSNVAVGINDTVIALQTLSQSSHKSARDIEGSSNELAGLASHLQQAVGQFKYQ